MAEKQAEETPVHRIVRCVDRIAVALERLANDRAPIIKMAMAETPFPWGDKRLSPRTINKLHWKYDRPKTIEAMQAIGRSNIIKGGCTRQIGEAGLSEIDEIMVEYGREVWMLS